MQKKFWIFMALFLIIPGLLFTVSCAQQTVKTEEEPVAEETPMEQPVETPAAEETPTAAPDYGSEDRAMEAAQNMFLNEHVHFAFDQSTLDEAAQDVLRRKSDFLQANSDVYFTIEGHCDERGTAEYNLALGDRRAQATKNFLVDLGVEAGRISTVSYGEERPLDPRSKEEAWAKNRRAQFMLQ